MSDIKLGRKVYIKLDLNGVGGAGANWVTIGQRTGGGLDRGTKSIDGQTQADDGWPSDEITGGDWSVTCEGALLPSDSAYMNLENAHTNGTKIWVQIDKSQISGTKKEGKAILEKMSEKYPVEGKVEYTLDIKGQSKLVTSP